MGTSTLVVFECSYFTEQSTVAIEHVVQDLKNLMHSIPSHATQFLEMVCKILTTYKEGCNSAYKGNMGLSTLKLRCFPKSDKSFVLT